MFHALVAFALLQAVEVDTRQCAVVLASRRSGADDAPKILAQVRSLLIAEGVAIDAEQQVATRLGKEDPRKCQGAQACLGKAADLLGGVVIGVDVARARKSLLVHLTAVAPGGELLHEMDIDVPLTRWQNALKVPVIGFARVVQERLAPAQSTPPESPPPTPPIVEAPTKDAPLVAKLDLPPRTPPPVVVAPQPAAARPGRWLALGGSVATAGATTAFAVISLSAKGAVDASRYDAGGVTGTRLTDAELRSKAATANTFATAALASAAATVVLAGVTTWLFVSTPPAREEDP